MLDTAGQSGQAVMLCLRYDFPAEWAIFVNGTANFAATLSRERFPYIVQGAPKLTIDKLTLCAANGAAIVQATPAVDLTALSSGLSSSPSVEQPGRAMESRASRRPFRRIGTDWHGVFCRGLDEIALIADGILVG
jgi:hypothetical protein